MRRPLFLILVMLLSIPFRMDALEVVSEVSRLTSPKVSVEQDDMGINVSYDISSVTKTEDDLFSKTYRLTIPGFAASINEGEPCLPQKWDTFEIPEGCDAVVEETELDYYSDKFDIAPARKPLVDSSDESYSYKNVQPVQKFAGWKPERNVSEGYVEVYRDRRLLRVGVFPVSYNIVSGEVRIAQKISYHITFVPSSVKLVREKKEMHDVDEDLFESMLTYDTNAEDASPEFAQKSANNAEFPFWQEAPWYLIITLPKYIDAVDKFVIWKKCMGYNFQVKTPVSGAWTVSDISSTIKNEYAKNKKLKYVLFVGTAAEIPSNSIGGEFPCLSDYPYVCMDGNGDKLADLYTGRISVSTLVEANGVFEKISLYEKNKSFSNIGLHCAEFSDKDDRFCYEDRRFTRTSEDIACGAVERGYEIDRVYYYNRGRNTPSLFDIASEESLIGGIGGVPVSLSSPCYWNDDIFSYGEPIPDFLKASTFSWKGNANSVVESINDGVAYILHRGHGNKLGWEYPDFTSTSVEKLNNGNATPVLFSINCKTGKFSDTSNNSTCFAEKILRKSGGGAVGVIAASETSYSGFNDVLVMELFQLLWPDVNVRYAFPDYAPDNNSTTRKPVKKIGELLNLAKVKLNEYYKNDDGRNECTKMIFHCFGDPGMSMQESRAHSPNISHTIKSDSQQVGGVTHVFNSPVPYTWVKIEKKTGKVSSFSGRSLSFTVMEMLNNMYYVLADDVPPTLVTSFINSSSNNQGRIKEIEISNSSQDMTVDYELESKSTSAKLSLSDVLTGSTHSVPISNEEESVVIPIGDLQKGVYVLGLWNDEVMIDNLKVVIK